MNRLFRSVLFIFLFVTSFAASDSFSDGTRVPESIIPPNIKNIAVRQMKDETGLAGPLDEFWLTLTDKLARDGRTSYVNDESKADGVLIGTVKQYHKSVVSYDENSIPREYQLWVIVDATFLDRTASAILWNEPRLERKIRFLTESQPGGKTLEDANNELWRSFADDFLRRTLDGPGSVTSTPSNRIPAGMPADAGAR